MKNSINQVIPHTRQYDEVTYKRLKKLDDLIFNRFG